MLKRLTIALAVGLVSVGSAVVAQNTNSTTTTRRQTTTNTNTTTQQTPATTSGDAAQPATRRARATRGSGGIQRGTAAAESAVRDAFDALVDGITRADVEAVMDVYWNSPQLLLFNNNGTVTRSWAQVKSNRSSSYPNLKDVKLAVSDVRVQMLGADGAVVTCLWTQSQTASGVPETATGRLTLVFRRVGTAWKAVHTHTSPDRPDPSLLLPSERTEPATTSPAPTQTPRPAATPAARP